jgi:DNA polymerase-3 subunit alpha
MCGIVSDIRTRLDRRENTIAFVRVEHYTGSFECVFWSDKWREFAELVQSDAILMFSGRCEVNGQNVKVYTDDVMSIERAEAELAKGYVIRIDSTQDKEQELRELRRHCDTVDANASLTFVVSKPEGKVQYHTGMKMKTTKETTAYLSSAFGESNVILNVEG